ncbi:MAG: anaerobic ribonucleoside-triphosphate reductase activating protein [Candidatus Methanomethylophilaceae archaeon]|jgi:pyruvate formate lyase activating enzyme
MKIGGFVKTTLSDWDGKVSCMIFLCGCNFSCPFCHNPDVAENRADSVNLDTVLEYIEKNRDFLDGIVISGGEPTVSGDLYGLLKKLKKTGIAVKLDTNGSNPEILDDIIGARLVDYVAMDIKTSLRADKYSEATGGYGKVDDIEKSIRIIIDSGIDHEFRTTVYPGAVSPEDIKEIASKIRGADRFCIQQFRPGVTMNPEAGKVKPYSEKELRSMKAAAEPFVKRVSVRGL